MFLLLYLALGFNVHIPGFPLPNDTLILQKNDIIKISKLFPNCYDYSH